MDITEKHSEENNFLKNETSSRVQCPLLPWTPVDILFGEYEDVPSLTLRLEQGSN